MNYRKRYWIKLLCLKLIGWYTFKCLVNPAAISLSDTNQFRRILQVPLYCQNMDWENIQNYKSALSREGGRENWKYIPKLRKKVKNLETSRFISRHIVILHIYLKLHTKDGNGLICGGSLEIPIIRGENTNAR